jgi:hypothetical protein
MYRDEDIEQIKLNLKNITNNAMTEYKTNYEPTIKENSEVYKAIKKYIEKKNRIVYGGFAQNILIMAKNPNDYFYKEIDGVFFNWPDVADIEFYSPTPIADLIELAEELHSKGFKHVSSEEGIHSETYKIFVNFINYCDISYMPKNVYDNLPVIVVNNIKCVSPHFMMVDTYRVLTDPLTSYYRLEKSIDRFQKIIKYYPIDVSHNKMEIKFQHPNEILKFIRKKIIQKSKLIVVGFYAFNYYVDKDSNQYFIKNIPYYEAISKNLSKDSKIIYHVLKKHGVTMKEFYPFISFMDSRVEYYYKDQLVFKLYGNNKRCTIYKYSEKKKTYFGTYNLVFMYLLFNYFYCYINRDKMSNILLALIGKLYEAKNNYLTKHNITVIDNSSFQDFTFKCFGVPNDTIRESRLKAIEKKKEGKPIKFRYNATGKQGKVPEFRFNNTSGNQKK